MPQSRRDDLTLSGLRRPGARRGVADRARSPRRWAWLLTAATAVLVTSAWLNAQRDLRPGGPLVGVTPAEFEEFRLGLDDFLEVETPEEGLGPAFNGTSCAGCHSVPAIGGVGPIAEVRAARQNAQGQFQALDPSGETLFHLFSVPSHGCQPVIPPEATVIARRVPIPVFGAGLVEAIPDEAILARDDPGDRVPLRLWVRQRLARPWPRLARLVQRPGVPRKQPIERLCRELLFPGSDRAKVVSAKLFGFASFLLEWNVNILGLNHSALGNRWDFQRFSTGS